MLEVIQSYVRKRRLLQPGERVGVAVSGGADSVALLRAMAELREEMGVQLAVVHFNHRIRGAESDADERFAAEFARELKLEFYVGEGDATACARKTKQSLETAARKLRYDFFYELIDQDRVDKVATAHTMDDQAETVLLRFLRGAGTRGLGGIHPTVNGKIVRPLLVVRRSEVEAYLQAKSQSWRNDVTNSDYTHSRNRVRHGILPVLREFNPAIVEILARSAEIARGEEDYWQKEISRLLPTMLLPGKAVRGGGRAIEALDKSCGLDMDALLRQPLAVQRRIIRATASTLHLELDQHHVEEALAVARGETRACELPGAWKLQRSFRELRFECEAPKTQTRGAKGYEYELPIPGEARVPDVNLLVRAYLKPMAKAEQGYNRGTPNPESKQPAVGAVRLLSGDRLDRLQPVAVNEALKIRNGRTGDRFFQAHSRNEVKVKEILQNLNVAAPERKNWPLITSGEKVVWVRGARNPALWLENNGSVAQVVIEMEEME